MASGMRMHDDDDNGVMKKLKQYAENLTAMLQNSNQNSTFPGLA